MVPPVDAGRVGAALAGRLGPVEVRERCPSTNDALAARAAADPSLSAAVLITLDQTAGKGRLGRTWSAPAGTAIACSVLVADVPEDLATWLPAVAGLAVLDLVRAAGIPAVAPASLKWPNDVLLGDRKVCGILGERVGTSRFVLGFGVNVAMPEDLLPVPTATSLLLAGAADLDPTPLVIAGLTSLAGRLDALAGSRVQEQATHYRRACSTLGTRVRVDLGTRAVEGVAVDVDSRARLVLRPDDGTADLTVAAGDVTHLRASS